ncbi:hypothetical protein Q9966_012082 [Columba livia]|nr:hypothetical protein Q9966_012082 [Columba livia]
MAGGGAAELRALYGWLDNVPLSRPRRNIARDFSDGVLAAEVVKFFFPAMVQLHSYVPASSTPQKLANWGHLNRKVLSKLNFSIPADMIREVVQCRPGTVEQVLLLLRQKIEEKQKQSKAVPGLGQAARPRRGGVRFAPSQPPEGAHGHVRFDEKLHDSAVMVTQEKDGSFLVKVGFLKILHKYEITFQLPPLERLGRDVCAVPVPNLNLRVIAVTPLPEGYSVQCEYTAHREGVLKEELVLASEAGEGASVKVTVQARVMDRHHGTPMLLDGVRCVGAELEYDSEQSDWHGFD